MFPSVLLIKQYLPWGCKLCCTDFVDGELAQSAVDDLADRLYSVFLTACVLGAVLVVAVILALSVSAVAGILPVNSPSCSAGVIVPS